MLQLITTQEELQLVVDGAVSRAYQKLPLIDLSVNPVEVINSATLMERLDISEPTLIRWRQKGKIPFMQIGTAVRYDWHKVLTALEVNTKKRG
jgi:hypothetical protein